MSYRFICKIGPEIELNIFPEGACMLNVSFDVGHLYLWFTFACDDLVIIHVQFGFKQISS